MASEVVVLAIAGAPVGGGAAPGPRLHGGPVWAAVLTQAGVRTQLRGAVRVCWHLLDSVESAPPVPGLRQALAEHAQEHAGVAAYCAFVVDGLVSAGGAEVEGFVPAEISVSGGSRWVLDRFGEVPVEGDVVAGSSLRDVAAAAGGRRRGGEVVLHRAALCGSDVEAVLGGRRWWLAPLAGAGRFAVHAAGGAETRAMWSQRADWYFRPSRGVREAFLAQRRHASFQVPAAAAASGGQDVDLQVAVPAPGVVAVPRPRHVLLYVNLY